MVNVLQKNLSVLTARRHFSGSNACKLRKDSKPSDKNPRKRKEENKDLKGEGARNSGFGHSYGIFLQDENGEPYQDSQSGQ